MFLCSRELRGTNRLGKREQRRARKPVSAAMGLVARGGRHSVARLSSARPIVPTLLPLVSILSFSHPGFGQQRARQRRRGWLLATLLLFLVLLVSLQLADGASALPLAALWQALWWQQAAEPLAVIVVWDIRLPMALLAVLVGMALGLAGAEMQTVLDNPLASPFTLGISSAAALGAALALVWGWVIPGVPARWWVGANAFVFAMLAAAALDRVARWRQLDATAVILFGVALVFACGALVSLIQFTASAEALQGLVFWTFGSLERADWPSVLVLALALGLVVPWAMQRAWALTALRMGEERAASLGVPVRRERLAALARVSLLAGLAVAMAGTIGFVGLVAPHIARRLFGEDHRWLLPGSAVVGGVLLSLAALVSRHVVPGVTLPLGIVTALVGVPVFVAVIFRQARRDTHA